MSGQALDCRAAVDRLYDYLDGELSAVDADRVRAHLETCGHCFRFFDFEAAFLRFLEARRRAEHAPAELRRRILDQMLSDEEPPAT